MSVAATHKEAIATAAVGGAAVDGVGRAEGMVVANDADNKRCYMLVHQTKRLQVRETHANSQP